MTLALNEFQAPTEGTRVALGFFDGVHLGHQALIARASHVFTFRNHPASVVSGRTPPALTLFHERVALLEKLGVQVVVRDFDRDFSQLSPEGFVERVLVGRLGARKALVGPNYRFGHRAQGDVEALSRWGQEHGFEVELVQPIEEGGEMVSSTRIRKLLSEGEVQQAAALLGRPYSVTAVVEKGDGRGAQLGFPTANLTLPARKVAPAFGVYAVTVEHGGESLPGVANYGKRPTFSGEKVLLEVHLLEHDLDLYGSRLQVSFQQRIRAEQKFSGPQELIAQIEHDVAAARALF